MDGWLNPKLLMSNSANAEAVFRSTAPELVVDGPARCGKTLTILQKLFHLHFKYRGLRSAIVRTDSVDLTDTIRYDIKETLLRYRLDDPRSPVRYGYGGINRFEHLYINGGEMRLGGMNKPGKVLGAEYDIVFFSQAEQSTEEQHQLLKTRVAGTSGIWKRRDGTVLFQFLMDANPDALDHYLKQREEEGLTEFISFTFDDNPLFNRGGVRTPMGVSVIEELDRSLIGVYHDRLFKGLWVSPAGAVFQIEDVHLLDTLPHDFDDYQIYNAMDFGMTAPSTCLWLAEHPRTGDVIIFREFRHTGLTIIELGNRVRELRKEGVIRTIIDNDEEKQKLLLSHCRIPTEMARKGPGSIQDGIYLIQQALKNAVEGKAGGLYFYKGLRDDIRPDPELIRNKKPLSVITEMRNYSFKDESKRTGSSNDDLPVKGNDHGIDPTRYWFLWREERRPTVGFAGTGARRKSII